MKTITFTALSIMAFFLVSCGEKEVRSYEEVSITSKQAAPSSASPHGAMAKKAGKAEPKKPTVAWDAPKGWVQDNSSVSSFRLATLVIDNDKTLQCAIIHLSKLSGGTEMVVKMWNSQAGVGEMNATETKGFVAKQKAFKTAGAFEAIFVDYTTEVKENNATSLLGAIVTIPDGLLFVKLPASKGALMKQKEKFISLVKSVKPVAGDDCCAK